MSELDRVKEQLVYLRFWMGIMVVTGISVIGWLISALTTADLRLWFAGAFAAVLIGLCAFLVHRRIERRIDQVGKL